MRFGLTRHTSTVWNLEKRIQGQANGEGTRLSQPQGIEEAEQLADLIVRARYGFTRIVSSDLHRAVETRDILNRRLGLPVETQKGLRECSFGKLEGLTIDEVRQKFGEPPITIFRDNFRAYDFREYGGEDQEQVLSRHMATLYRLADQYADEMILLVGHSRGLETLRHGLGYEPALQRGVVSLLELDD
jgi:probable phosphoglycerate mutase